MRHYFWFTLAVPCILLTACSSQNAQDGTITLIPTSARASTTEPPEPELTEEDLGGYVPMSELSTFPGCGLDDIICAAFPYASETQPEQPTVVSMYDEVGAEVIFSSVFLDVATQQGKPVVCKNFLSFGCPDEGTDPQSVASEQYSIRSLPAYKPGYTLTQLSNCFDGAVPLAQVPVVISGVSGLKTSCTLPPDRAGRVDFIILIVDGEAYEVAASSDIGPPSQEEAFFDSIAIAERS